MDDNIKSLALLSGMKLKEFYPDEHKTMGWVNITCTEYELERYTNMVLAGKATVLSELKHNSDKK